MSDGDCGRARGPDPALRQVRVQGVQWEGGEVSCDWSRQAAVLASDWSRFYQNIPAELRLVVPRYGGTMELPDRWAAIGGDRSRDLSPHLWLVQPRQVPGDGEPDPGPPQAQRDGPQDGDKE